MKRKILIGFLLTCLTTLCFGQNVDWLNKIKGYACSNPTIKVLDNDIINILGMFQDTICFDSISITTNGMKFYSVKYDNSGLLLFKKVIEPPPSNICSTAIDNDGNLYFAGYFSGSIQFDTITLNSIGLNDIYIEKTDSLGNIIWAKQFGTIGNDYIWSMYIDSHENVLFTPSFNNYTDCPIIKLDSDGILLWNKLFYVNENILWPSALDFDTLLNVYITGFFMDTVVISDNIFIDTLYSDNCGDLYMMKLNEQGYIQWVKRTYHSVPATFSNYIYPEFSCVDDSGNSFVIGSFSDTIFIDNYTLSSDTSSYFGADYFLIKYSTDGDVVWAKDIGSYNSAELTGIYTDNKHFFFTGTYYYYIKFEGVNYPNTIGNENMYLCKYDNNTGSQIWLDHIQGEAEEAYLSLNNNGDAFLIGPVYDTTLYFANNNFISQFYWNDPISSCDVLFLVKYTDTPEFITENSLQNSDFILYPNPANDNISIKLNSFEISQTNYIVAIKDIYGKEIFETILNTNPFTFDLNRLKPGMYFIEIIIDSKRSVKKFIKLN